MKRGLLAKFTQHPSLHNLLIETNDAELIESSPCDLYWGSGWNMENWRDGWTDNKKNWRGKNRMGECLMDVRKMILTC